MWDLRARPAILCLKASGTALCDSQRLYAAWCRQVGQEDSKTKKPRKTMKIRRGPKMQYILLFFDNYS